MVILGNMVGLGRAGIAWPKNIKGVMQIRVIDVLPIR